MSLSCPIVMHEHRNNFICIYNIKKYSFLSFLSVTCDLITSSRIAQRSAVVLCCTKTARGKRQRGEGGRWRGGKWETGEADTALVQPSVMVHSSAQPPCWWSHNSNTSNTQLLSDVYHLKMLITILRFFLKQVCKIGTRGAVKGCTLIRSTCELSKQKYSFIGKTFGGVFLCEFLLLRLSSRQEWNCFISSLSG